jgi:hypothetical protein
MSTTSGLRFALFNSEKFEFTELTDEVYFEDENVRSFVEYDNDLFAMSLMYHPGSNIQIVDRTT